MIELLADATRAIGLQEIAKFLGGKFSSALFNVSAQCQLTGKPRADQKLTVSFAEKHLPSWFNCLQSSESGQLTPERWCDLPLGTIF